jgi:hypothetical protein
VVLPNHLAALVNAIGDVEIMLGALQSSFFLNSDIGGKVIIAIEQSFEGADFRFEFINWVGLLEGFCGGVWFAALVRVVEFG